MPYYNDEAIDRFMVLEERLQNYTAAITAFSQHYPLREHHSRTVFQSLTNHVRETEKVQPSHMNNQQITRQAHDGRAINVLAVVELNSHGSTRRLAVASGVSHI